MSGLTASVTEAYVVNELSFSSFWHPNAVDRATTARIKEIVPDAEKHDVILLVETNGVYADTNRLADLLNDIASDNVAALWDVHHPYRYFGESAETTLTNLGGI